MSRRSTALLAVGALAAAASIDARGRLPKSDLSQKAQRKRKLRRQIARKSRAANRRGAR